MTQDDSHAPERLAPMPPSLFHILLCLGNGERHGYAIKREIAARTDGRLKLGPGVLYGSLQKLEEMGLIEESEERIHISTMSGGATIGSRRWAGKRRRPKRRA